MKFKHLMSTLLALMISITLFANKDIPDVPKKQRLVNDFANVLSNQQQNALEAKLTDYALKTTTQITVVTVNSLNGYDRADFATRLAHKWKIGQKGKDNGVLLLVKPKTSNSRGQVYVAVGYGLEGVIPDAIANRDIVNKELIPYFKRNDYYTGIDRATTVMMGLAAGEFTPQAYHKSVSGKKKKRASGFGALIFIFIILVALVGSRRRGRSYGMGGSSLPFWAALTMLNSNRHSHNGFFDDFSSGSGGFGGGSSFGGGGGFGGFGGGGFGGGGAGGSW
ncbi:TPM domain-containing protein [Prolixibacteraceae bacterium JC049]|nr:TPM domain-containing protein [Prolixibacteraceae bacterium JC049]